MIGLTARKASDARHDRVVADDLLRANFRSKGRPAARVPQSAPIERLESRLLLSANSAPSLGVNIRRLGYDSGDELFADAMKEPGAWSTNLAAPGSLTPPDLAAIDANGWPTSDAGVKIISNTSDDGGTYALSFTGQATVASIPTEPLVQVVNPVYDAATNTTTAQIIVPAGANELMLDFTNTRRLATDTTPTGITSVQLMRPSSVDGAISYPSSTRFSTPILNLLSNFSTIRFMDYSLTNNNTQANWSDRTLPAQVQTNGKGGAWEYAVALGNQAGEDIWINIPELATDAYITNLAQLINYGSDGVNPYTGAVGSTITAANPNPVPVSGPVWAGLNPSLHVYLEYSNEVWNYSFAQSVQNLHAAISEVDAGSSPLNYDGDGAESDWAIRRTAERTVDTSNIFRNVFGDSQMLSQIRPVYQWQYANLNASAALGLNFLNNYYNNADGNQNVVNPHPVNYYLWGGGAGWYGGVNNATGIGDVTVSQGTFTTPVVSGFQPDPIGSAWSFAGSAGMVANGSTLANPPAVAGTQAAYFQGTGSFSETVNFSGGLADIAFSAATTGTESFSVSIDGNDASTPWILASAYGVQRSVVFDTGIAAGMHTVTFTGVGGTGAVFISNVVAETANGMYQSGIHDISATIQTESSWAAAFGLHEASYEGGFDFGSGWVGTPLQIAANQDPRAQQAELQEINQFYASGGGLGMYYDTTNHIWALTLDINNQNTAKIRAIQTSLVEPRPALNFGALLPTIAGQSVSVANTLGAYAGAAGLYALDAASPGTYTVSLAGRQSGAEVVQVMLDGQLLPGFATLPVSSTGSSTPALTFTLATPGVHSLFLITSGSGTITPNNPAGSLTITAGPGAALPAVPAAVTGLGAIAVGLAQVNLAWTAAAGALGYRVERSSDGVHFKIVGSTVSPSYVDKLVAPGTTYTYKIVAYNAGGVATESAGASAALSPASVPSPWTDTDIGATGVAGYANYSSSSATWTVAGGGSNIWSNADEFNFLNQPLTGDATLVAKVVSIGKTNNLAESGIMFRASTGATDLFVDLLIQAGGGIAMQSRAAVGASVVNLSSGSSHIVAPQWLKLVRVANTFTGYYSADGITWTSIGAPTNLALPATALAGLAVVAHGNSLRSVSTFTHVSPSFVVANQVTGQSAVFQGSIGQNTTAAVATFTDSNTAASASEFSANISWGDGQSSVGTIVSNGGGQFIIVGSHAYAAVSSTGYALVVTLKDSQSPDLTIVSSVSLVTGSLTALTMPIAPASAGVYFKNALVGMFLDNNAGQKSSAAYAGTIYWGDGAKSTANFRFISATAGVGSYWHLIGSYVYKKPGTYQIKSIIHLAQNVTDTVTILETITVT